MISMTPADANDVCRPEQGSEWEIGDEDWEEIWRGFEGAGE